VRLRRFAIGAAIALLLLLVLTMLPRHSVSRELLADAASRDSAPTVQVAMVSRAAPGSALTLPGTVQPLHESAIYARVGGYVRRTRRPWRTRRRRKRTCVGSSRRAGSPASRRPSRASSPRAMSTWGR